jgi:FixJ family two-component response regulator
MCLDATVFLIEDDVAVRDALSISLRMAGLIVEVYSSGKAFLETCKADRQGCLLINLSQGEMGGLTMQQELIRRNVLTPIILMTEIGTIQDYLPTMQTGTFFLLEKPFSRSLLLESIYAALEQGCRNSSVINAQAGTDDF